MHQFSPEAQREPRQALALANTIIMSGGRQNQLTVARTEPAIQLAAGLLTLRFLQEPSTVAAPASGRRFKSRAHVGRDVKADHRPGARSGLVFRCSLLASSIQYRREAGEDLG